MTRTYEKAGRRPKSVPPWVWVAIAIAVGGALGWGALAVVNGVFSSPSWSEPPLAEGAVLPAPKAAQQEEARAVGEAKRPEGNRRPLKPPPTLPAFTSMYEWPHEPEAPLDVDEQLFTEALVLLCGPYADREVRSWYAGWALRYAREFGIDPFLLGALMFRQSGCAQGHAEAKGLTGLSPELYVDDFVGGTYQYRAFESGRWVPRKLELARFPFEREFIQAPESNLYFAAAFLRAWQEQHRGLFAGFVQKEYRHYVSHFLWGDRVGSARQEDWILVDRRRLLEYYGARAPAAPVEFQGFSLGCPLDGCPRLVTSTLGDVREGGKRTHRGTDFESTLGEPVRAVADGLVLFAGVDLPGKASNRRLPIYAQRSAERSVMGAGGLYVCIRHDRKASKDSIVSCYMHLDKATVSQGRLVKRGDQIGLVGRTGIKVSAPHLHFELHTAQGIQAAEQVLGPLAIGKPPVHEAPRAEVAGAEEMGRRAKPAEPETRVAPKKAKPAELDVDALLDRVRVKTLE